MNILTAKQAISASLIGLATLFVALSASAEEAPYSRTLIVHATASSVEALDTVTSQSIEIKSESAIAQFAQITLNANEHFADVQITEAATIKADGRRINVAPDKILVSAYPNAPLMGVFEADVKTRTIVFPDVAVGDTVVYTMVSHAKTSALPSGFQLAYVIDASSRFDKVEISLDSPAGVAIHRAVAGFSETVANAGGRNRFLWIKEPQAYRAAEPNATAAIDREPHVIISSYASQEAFAEMFFKSARSKSAPTPAVRALAETITANATTPREQARAIFDWVTRNVRYYGIFLGNGGWVPHDADSILTAKYGDCKDHATLMRALLAAKGIESDYALINTFPTYRDLGIPFPGLYNHVILYLPEFDLYADPTARYSSFDYLPESEADKVVLRVGARGAAAARTPVLSADTNTITVKAEVTFRPDGTPFGATTTEARGPIASVLRATVAQAALKGSAVFAKEQLARQNWRGSGDLELRDSLDHADPFLVKSSFDLTNRFFGRGPNRYTIPTGLRLTGSDFALPLQFLREKHTQDFFCEAGAYLQIIDLTLPDGQSLARTPANVAVASPLASYVATYVLTGQVLHIERRFVTKVAAQVCDRQITQELSPVLLAAAHDFNVRLVFSNEGVDAAADDE